MFFFPFSFFSSLIFLYLFTASPFFFCLLLWKISITIFWPFFKFCFVKTIAFSCFLLCRLLDDINILNIIFFCLCLKLNEAILTAQISLCSYDNILIQSSSIYILSSKQEKKTLLILCVPRFWYLTKHLCHNLAFYDILFNFFFSM